MKVSRTVFPILLTLCLMAAQAQAQLLRSGEIRINSETAGAQLLPDTETILVKARLFDAAGEPRSGEIQVGRHRAAAYPGARVAMALDGRFVVVWTGGTSIADVVYGRRYAANGAPLGGRIRLATIRSGQDSPDVAMAADGSFVAAWSQRVAKEHPDDPDEIAIDVNVRRFGPNGQPLGPETLAIGGSDEQSGPELAMRPNGDFVIACDIYRGESSFYDVVAQRFSSTGDPTGELIEVNEELTADSSQSGPAIALAADGRFAIAWTDRLSDFARGGTDFSTDDPTGVVIRVFAADGTALGPGRPVNTHVPGTQAGPAVNALPNGTFVVLWTSGDDQDGDEYGIFGRLVAADGTPRGREIRINIQRGGLQWAPALAIAANGKGVAAWYGPDGAGTGIFARLIGLPRQGY